MKEVIITNKNKVVPQAFDSPVIFKEFSNSIVNRKSNIVSILSEVTSGLNNIKDIIEPDKIYIAKFPKDIIDKMNSGQYDIMTSKSGELLSTIIDKTKPGNRNIVHQLRLDEIDPAYSGKLQNLSNNIANIAIQKQLADVTEMLSELLNLSKDIKRGQVLDRIGLVYSGRSQLEQALEIVGDNPRREQLIIGAINSLNNGRSQLDLYFREEIKNIPPISNNKFKLTMKCLFDSKFYGKVEDSFNELQESFQAYIYATNLLATAYERMGNVEVLPKVYAPARAIIEEYSESMISISEIVIRGNVVKEKSWYNNPNEYIDVIENYSKQALLEDIEYISIEFTGQNLLEGK